MIRIYYLSNEFLSFWSQTVTILFCIPGTTKFHQKPQQQYQSNSFVGIDDEESDLAAAVPLDNVLEEEIPESPIAPIPTKIMEAHSTSDLDHDKGINTYLSETLDMINSITNEEDLPIAMQPHYHLFYEDLKFITPEIKKKDNSHLHDKDCDKKHGGHGHGEEDGHGHGEEEEEGGHGHSREDSHAHEDNDEGGHAHAENDAAEGGHGHAI